jgi:hypothetical protein
LKRTKGIYDAARIYADRRDDDDWCSKQHLIVEWDSPVSTS